MTHDRTPPPQTRTPAELAGRHLIAYYENRATDLGEGEALEATFIAPSGTELTAVALFPLTDTILGIDALDAAGTRHLLFLPCAPLQFTYIVVKDDGRARQPLGFHRSLQGIDA